MIDDRSMTACVLLALFLLSPVVLAVAVVFFYSNMPIALAKRS